MMSSSLQFTTSRFQDNINQLSTLATSYASHINSKNLGNIYVNEVLYVLPLCIETFGLVFMSSALSLNYYFGSTFN